MDECVSQEILPRRQPVSSELLQQNTYNPFLSIPSALVLVRNTPYSKNKFGRHESSTYYNTPLMIQLFF